MANDKATAIAAQLWTLPEFSGREMDAPFAAAIANAIETAVADAVKDPIEKLQAKTKELAVEASERKAAEKALDAKGIEAASFWDQLVEKQKDMERMRKSKGEVAGDRDHWKHRAERAEAASPEGFKAMQDQVEGLRKEIAGLHRILNERDKALEDKTTENRVNLRLYSDAQTKFQLLEGTAQQMQAARDIAEKREVEAFKALDDLKAKSQKLQKDHDELAQGMATALTKLGTLKAIHGKEHGKPLPFCAVCKVLSPAPAVPAVQAEPATAVAAQASA